MTDAERVAAGPMVALERITATVSDRLTDDTARAASSCCEEQGTRAPSLPQRSSSAISARDPRTAAKHETQASHAQAASQCGG